LLCFAGAARKIDLSMLGILQYIAPTLQFTLGVMVYHEPFTKSRLTGFLFIWLALLVFSLEGLAYQWRRRQNEKLMV
jgi:chloramphenicol-sensitive protein RarD